MNLLLNYIQLWEGKPFCIIYNYLFAIIIGVDKNYNNKRMLYKKEYV